MTDDELSSARGGTGRGGEARPSDLAAPASLRGADELPPLVLRHRWLLAAIANAGVIATAYCLAFLIRFDLVPPPWRLTATALMTLPVAVLVQYVCFYFWKLSRGWWRYVGIVDLVNAVKASAAGSVITAAYVYLVHPRSGWPRSFFLLFPLLVVCLSIGARILVRLSRRAPSVPGTAKRLLIVGAGDTGEALMRELRQSARLRYTPIAFLDDDPRKRGAYIHGLPVVGTVDDVQRTVKRLSIDEIIVATPSAAGTEMRRIADLCRAAGKPTKVMPATWEVLHGRASLRAARDVDIHDLLRRPPVALDLAAIGRFLTGKRVLVTGAAGSIGSELCRQVLHFAPAELVGVDHDENAIFFLDRQLRTHEHGARARLRLGDVTEVGWLDDVFRRFKPEVVFHAAAHKHVPIVEDNVTEAVRNNVFGTEIVATLAGRHGAEAFVLISTDKAVRPSSVMGATKRLAELIVRTLPFDTRYVAVRFGNVLGSQGSVVPLFKAQIAAGGPVTVTHPEMTRYFMTIPEACELVLQAGAMGQEDEVFMLDMGEPVRILDLAEDLIRLSGLVPNVDIPIEFTGVRPGEKLAEELHLDEELAQETSHPKIMTLRHVPIDRERFRYHLDELRKGTAQHDEDELHRLLPVLVPEFLGKRRRQVLQLKAV